MAFPLLEPLRYVASPTSQAFPAIGRMMVPRKASPSPDLQRQAGRQVRAGAWGCYIHDQYKGRGRPDRVCTSTGMHSLLSGTHSACPMPPPRLQVTGP